MFAELLFVRLSRPAMLRAFTALLSVVGTFANDPAGSWLSYARYDAPNEGVITALNTTWVVPSLPQTSFGSNAPGWWFGVMDKDGDGALNAEELAARGEGRAGAGRGGKWQARMMDRMDGDKDGKLSLEEMTARRDPARMFEKLDADGDGALSAEEFGKMRGHRGKRHHGDKG